MIHVARSIHYATPTQGVAGSAVWVLRWLLVLVLMMDQISSPLHRHHHDSGIDGSAIHGYQLGVLPAVHHIEGDVHEPSVFHSVTTLRIESRLLAVEAPSHADPKPMALAAAWPLPWLDVETSGSVIWAAPVAPPHKLHRSLPPAGRAPPTSA